MTKPTRANVAGQRYLDLQKLARDTKRRTDELFQLYALEGFLDRMSRSRYAENLVLKGGVLLAAFDTRRPTRDIDFAASAFDNDVEIVQNAVVEIATVHLDDGIEFDASAAVSHSIRDEHDYSGVRVEMTAALSRARLSFHVDINVGDPISPSPSIVEVPRLLGGSLRVRGYPIEMVLAEKLVTALERGVANTRWRDFLDVFTLIGRYRLDGAVIRQSVAVVVEHRSVELSSLSERLAHFPEVGGQRWSVWLHKNDLAGIPSLKDVVGRICAFADPVFRDEISRCRWEPATQKWTANADPVEDV